RPKRRRQERRGESVGGHVEGLRQRPLRAGGVHREADRRVLQPRRRPAPRSRARSERRGAPRRSRSLQDPPLPRRRLAVANRLRPRVSRSARHASGGLCGPGARRARGGASGPDRSGGEGEPLRGAARDHRRLEEVVVLALAFDFLAGRYHATPWGRHVNEADVAWPPDPWRIARALLATWRRKIEPREIARETIGRLLEKLASELPSYALPPAVHAHARHYMPIREGRAEKTTLVFDAFARFGAGSRLVVAWSGIRLDTDE